jgi:hypothetical protein
MRKLTIGAAIAALAVSSTAMAAMPVRASDSATVSVATPIGASGRLGTKETAKSDDLVGGTLIIALLAAAAVVAGVVAATSSHHHGSSN